MSRLPPGDSPPEAAVEWPAPPQSTGCAPYWLAAVVASLARRNA